MGQLGRYEIIEQTGSGAMGIVYHAHDATLDREVALKTIRTGVDVDPEVRQRFYREARACARLQHPNIIAVYDLGEVENTAFIAMELLKGADFRRIIQERRSISVEVRIAACIEVCDAIAHAHRHGVIHRDIKPSNLFLTDEGRTKVLDFGIARLPSSRLTVAGQILGTPNYMAPEQILAQPSDGRADLFSAAVVFFEFLAYAHPFQSNFIPRRIVQSEPDSLFDGNTSLPVILEKVLARGLAKDPGLRYQTGDEFGADLRTVLDALRGDASPGFSGVQLPSERAIPVAEPQPDSANTVAAPEGQDPQEWRLSEALRLLPDFESAVDRRDLARAEEVISDLEHRLAGDVRFMEAIRLCQSRLKELGFEMPAPARPAAQSAASVGGQGLGKRPPTTHQAQAGDGVNGDVDLNATFFGLSATSVVDPPSQPPQPPLPGPPVGAPSFGYVTGLTTSVPPSSTAQHIVKQKLGRRKLVLIAGVIVPGALLVLAAGVIALRPVAVESNVATAVVRVASANIWAGPGTAAKKIVSVSNGAALNVLRLPTSRDQEWVSVQAVKPRVLRPGYIRTAELGAWDCRTGAAALSLIRILDPGESGSEEAIHAQIQELENLTSRFVGEPAANEARLEIARLHITLARRHKAAGRVLEDWQPELKAARQDLELAGGERTLQAQALDLTVQTDELLAGQPPVVPPPLNPGDVLQSPPPDLSKQLGRAYQLYQDGAYREAEAMIGRILRISHGNKEALILRGKIKRAYDGEQK